MFNIFRRKTISNDLYAPVNGKMIAIAEVPDEVFNTKMMGDGVGFIFEEATVYSPCDGKIMLIAPTKHAIGIIMDNGQEILVHVGLDSVGLDGKGFTVLVNVGEKIKHGLPIVEIDHKVMSENTINMITPLVVTNSGEYDINVVKSYGAVGIEEVIITTSKK